MSLWCYRGGRVLYTDEDVQYLLIEKPYEQFVPADFADWERITGEAYVRSPADPFLQPVP
jgi:hypothetical protein